MEAGARVLEDGNRKEVGDGGHEALGTIGFCAKATGDKVGLPLAPYPATAPSDAINNNQHTDGPHDANFTGVDDGDLNNFTLLNRG